MLLFYRLVERLSFALYVVAIATILLMMAHICADVFCRYVFGTPLHATLEMTTNYYMPIVVTLPVAIAQLRNEHIAVEVFTQYLSARSRARLFLVDALIVLPYLGAFFWFSFQEAIKKTLVGEFIFAIKFDLPVWPSRWVVPIAYLLLTLCILWQVLSSFAFLRAGAQGKAPFETHHIDYTV